MYYFLANLSVHVFVCIVLIALIIVFNNRNFKRKTKHSFTYFVPVILTILIGLDIFRYLAPRLFDINNVLNNVTYIQSGVVDEVSAFNNYFRMGDKTFFINPLRSNIEAGDTVRVRYTPSSNYAMTVWRNADALDADEG